MSQTWYFMFGAILRLLLLEHNPRGGLEKDRLSMSYQTLLHKLYEKWLGEGGTCSVPVLCVNTNRGQIDVGTLAKRIVSMLQL